MIDISISNSNLRQRVGNSRYSTYHRRKKLKEQDETIMFVGNNKHLWYGSFNEGFSYRKAKTKPAIATYEI